MKRIIALSAIVLGLVMCGCENMVPDSSVAGELVQEKQNVEVKTEKNQACKTVISETEYDFDGDGNDDSVVLMTSAEADDGELLWDDTNTWCIYAEINGQLYEFYDKKLSTGKVSYSVFENKNGKPVVTVIEETSASYRITEYIYEKDGFTMSAVFSEEDINLIDSSFDYLTVDE